MATDAPTTRAVRRARHVPRAGEMPALPDSAYRSLVENAVEGIFRTTVDGRYLIANQALADLYGYRTPAELIASVTDIARQLYVDPSRRALFRTLMSRTDTLAGFESEVRRRDGTLIWIREKARAVRDEHGVLVAYEGFIEDITAERRRHP